MMSAPDKSPTLPTRRTSRGALLPSTARRLINATNLCYGGGAAVAVSFIYDVSRIPREAAKYSVMASEFVDRELRALRCPTDAFADYRVASHYGLRALWSGLAREMERFDLVFTVFGPCYALGYRGVHLVGFADPWIAYPRNEAYGRLSLMAAWRTRFEWLLRELFYLNSSVLICELEHVPKALMRNTCLRRREMAVVHSAIPSVYSDPSLWLPVKIPRRTGVVNAGLISRNYPHKNLALLPSLKATLSHVHGLEVDFYVTFSDEEWAACTPEFRASIVNVGLLRLNQCPSFYEGMDVVVFPSLLECFSAVPIETLSMRKPLVASDRDFVRDCCDKFAFYFDPADLDAAAVAFVRAWEHAADEAYLTAACTHVQMFGSSLRRTQRYLAVIDSYIEQATTKGNTAAEEEI